MRLRRRRLVLASLALPALQGCAAPLPELSNPGTAPGARALLERSAAAHGFTAFSRLNDLNVSYAGEWPALIGRLQPTLVDSGFRGGSEERLLLRGGPMVVAQAHTGPIGRKQVVRRAARGGQGDVRVWFNGEEARDDERRAAAARRTTCLRPFGPAWACATTMRPRSSRRSSEPPRNPESIRAGCSLPISAGHSPA